MQQTGKRRSIGKRIFRIVLKTILWIFLLIVTLFLLILTPPVQRFITNKATHYLEKKLDTRVSIGRLFITLSGKIAVDKMYIEDRSKDTLMSAGRLRVNLNFSQLIFNGALNIEDIQVDDLTAKISRQLPDTVFNFQFIADAFSSGKKDTVQLADTSSGGMPISLDKIELNRIRLLYRDVVTGSDVEAGFDHFDTKIDKFDLDKLNFIVSTAHVNGLGARIVLTKPLIVTTRADSVKAAAQTTTQPEPVLQLRFGTIDLQQSWLDYRDSVGALYAALKIGELNVKPRSIDLAKNNFDLGDIILAQTTGAVRMGKTKAAVEKKTPPAATADTAGWGVGLAVNSISLKSIALQYDDDNKPREKQGMDYFHLKADISTFELNKFIMAGDSIRGSLVNAVLKEQSGFQLDQLKTDFLYSGREAYLRDLYFKTPGSELKKEAFIAYASIDALSKDIGKMQVQADIVQGKIKVSDVLTFVPSLREQPAFADPNATWYLDGKISGRVDALKIERLKVSGLHNTRVDLNGTINGVPDMNKLYADLTIRQLSSSRNDILAFVPKNTIPDNITLPSAMNLSGRVKGGMNDLFTDLQLRSDLGDATVKGTLRNITDKHRAHYDMQVNTSSLDLRTILKDTMYGPVTLTVHAKGDGYDPHTANGVINGTVQSAVFNKYTYRDFVINAQVADQHAQAEASIHDPNIDFTLQGSANLINTYPSDLNVHLMIDSIKAQELHFTDSVLTYHGKIDADFADGNPDSLAGKLLVTESVLVEGRRRITMDTISVLAGDTLGKQFIALESSVSSVRLEGKYKLTQLGDVLLQSIHPYYAIGGPDVIMKPTDPYNFMIQASATDNPVLRSFVPGLEKMVGVSLQSHFASDSGITATLNAAEISISGTDIRGLRLDAVTKDSALLIDTRLGQLNNGPDLRLDSTALIATLKDNKIAFQLLAKDKADKLKYTVGAHLEQTPDGDIVFSLIPESLMLKYDKWQVADNNRIIIFSKGGVNASNFALSRSGQELSINSKSPVADAPMDVVLKDFRLSTLTSLVMSDSSIIEGVASGQVELHDLTTSPIFVGDIVINDFSYHKDTLGNIHTKVNNSTSGVYQAEVTLDGRGNSATINGNYNASAASFDADIDLAHLPMKTVEALSGGAIRNTEGYVTGKLKARGTASAPSITGDVDFHQAGLNIAAFNSYFTLDGQKLQFDEQGIRFNKFAIKDSSGNPLTIDGVATTKDYRHYQFNLDITANNFRALNSTVKDNKIFYGQLYLNANLKVKGTESAPAVDGRVAVNDKTKMTVVLPQSDPGVVDRDGVVEFVDMSSPASDSLFLEEMADTLSKSSMFQGMDISVNLNVNKAADFTLIIDEANGDFLHLKGEAQINTGIDPSGKINMVGNYEVDEGTYELSFNMLKRKFNIQKGSMITWQGEPTDAVVNITAKYSTKAAPYDLVQNTLGSEDEAQRNRYLQKIPIDVLLKMNGPLLKPEITFDIVLPDNKNLGVSADIIEKTKIQLEQLRQTPNDMNKQVFSLLLLNRFVADNPFATSGSSIGTDLVRQSVSALMADQLNRLAEGLIEGVDINFGIESSDDYSSGERQSRTDLNVGVSKKLMNDRLTVTVGSDITLEGPQTENNQSMIGGNIAVDYALSADGRYKIRAYCINDYEGVIDGYVVETGVGFIITVDYNKFKQIFQSKKKRDEERRKRLEDQKRQADQQPQQAPAKGTGNK